MEILIVTKWSPFSHQIVTDDFWKFLMTLSRLTPSLHFGAPGGIRTHHPWLRKPILYPNELRARMLENAVFKVMPDKKSVRHPQKANAA
jgi:hypothetical protein